MEAANPYTDSPADVIDVYLNQLAELASLPEPVEFEDEYDRPNEIREEVGADRLQSLPDHPDKDPEQKQAEVVEALIQWCHETQKALDDNPTNRKDLIETGMNCGDYGPSDPEMINKHMIVVNFTGPLISREKTGQSFRFNIDFYYFSTGEIYIGMYVGTNSQRPFLLDTSLQTLLNDEFSDFKQRFSELGELLDEAEELADETIYTYKQAVVKLLKEKGESDKEIARKLGSSRGEVSRVDATIMDGKEEVRDYLQKTAKTLEFLASNE